MRIIGAGSGHHFRLIGFQLGFKAILRAMCFVGDDHNVVPVGEYREGIFILAGHEFLDSRKDDAAGWPITQLGAQVLPGADLNWLFAQQVLRKGEDTEQLAVEVIAVGDDNDGRVLHRRFLHHAGGKAGHGDALAAALRMPDHATFLTATRARGSNILVDGGAYGVELVIPGDLLNQRAVILEQNEKAQVVE